MSRVCTATPRLVNSRITARRVYFLTEEKNSAMLPLVQLTEVAGGSQARTQAQVFALILTKGPLSRSDVSRLTGLSQATITKAVKPMIASGYVIEEQERAQGPGRPVIPLRASSDSHYVVGFKLTAHELVGVVTNPQAEVLVSAHRSLEQPAPEQAVGAIADLTEELLGARPRFRARAEGLGVGLGGHVDERSGTLRYSPLLGWRDVPLARMLEEATGLPTVVENDVNALAVAEQWFGAGKDVPNFAVVTVGAGVGCGLVLDNDLFLGATGMAGELGHVAVVPDGEPCRCGNRGCLETVASDDAILKAVRAGGARAATIAEAAALAREGDAAARRAFARAGEALGRGIAALLNLVNPARIVLSGEGVVASDLLLESLRLSLERHAFSSVAGDCEIVTRPLADETWARGAAANVLRHLIAGPVHRRPTLAGISRR
jgi:predicted NBD/HSP70 family sugar kinase/biotin operon repressor